jgi:hypothetical protein
VRGGSVPREKASGDPDRRKGRLSASLICRALGWRHLKNQSPHGLIHTGSGGAATLQSFARGRNLKMLLAPVPTISPRPCDGQIEFGLIPVIHRGVRWPKGKRPRNALAYLQRTLTQQNCVILLLCMRSFHFVKR